LLHVKPQFVPSHVAVAFAGTAQAEHDEPHVAVALLLAHAPLQLW
jgi:hypothetical protein